MDPQLWAAGGFVVNVLLGGIMWFMRQTYMDIKDKQKALDAALEHVKENYYRKEDFREFKDELWRRLDKMESHWQEKLNELRQ